MSIIRAIIIALLPVIAAMPVQAREVVTPNTIDSLKSCLREVHSAADSLTILNDLLDLSPRKYYDVLGDSVYNVALRAGDNSAALDVLRFLANRNLRRDSMLNVLETRALTFPESPERNETITFIKMIKNMRVARYSTPDERQEALRDFIKRLEHIDDNNIYERIALTHGICMMLSSDSDGDLSVNYMDSLGTLIKRLPPSIVSLRTVYNVHAATIFADSHPEKSIVADMSTLNDIHHLERYYRDKGRNFRQYAPSYYTVYQRLLSNYNILDTAKVEEYYSEAMKQIPLDEAVKHTYDNSPYPEIYRNMFYKRYDQALPLIQHTLKTNKNLSRPRLNKLWRMEIECAKALGDKNSLLDAYELYCTSLTDEINERSQSAYRELQSAYAIHDIKSQLGQVEAEKRSSIAKIERKGFIFTLVAIILLVSLIVVLYFSYRRNRRLASTLAVSNERLISEGENLRQSRAELIRARDQAQKANNLKSDFIKNMTYEVKVPLQAINEYSHLIADCVAGSNGSSPESLRHLSRFADLVEFNSELLNTIIDDVFRLSEIDSDSMPLHCQVVNLKTLCETAVSSASHRCQPQVTMKLDPECGRLDVFTDPTRVLQVLNNLLTNAAKFTTKGTISIGFSIDEVSDRVMITVTDTGIGINPENKDKIFDRFVKLDRDTQGAGLGLTIARLIARRLNGDLTLDTSYNNGARFVFTLPRH